MGAELPRGWTPHRVGDLAEVFDGPHATPKTVDEGPIFLGIQALRQGRLDLTQTRHVTEDDFKAWTRRVAPQEDDVVFSYETRLGEAALIPAGIRCCLGRRMGLLRVRSQAVVTSRMLLLAYIGPQFQAELRLNTVQGSTVNRLPINRFADFRMVLPPLKEQYAIASVLGALDDKIESSRRLADAATSTWIEPATEALRLGGSQVSVSELIANGSILINDGYRARNAELTNAGIPFLRARNLTANGLDLADADLVPPEVVARTGTKVSATWDTAFTSKGTVGRITLIEPDTEPSVYSPQVCFWRSTAPSKLSPFVLHAWMRSARFESQVQAVKGQTDMADYVSLRDQRAMQMDLLEPARQAEVDALADPMARLAAISRREGYTLTAIRDALLPKLVSGKIRVPVSDDPEEQVGTVVEALNS